MAGQRSTVLLPLVFALFACALAASGRAQAPGEKVGWVWANGNSTETASSISGVYGTLGVAAPANTPPGRGFPAVWTDKEGNFWLFGGDAENKAHSTPLPFNDLWKFDPATAEWTWMGGATNLTAVSSTYGQLGVAAPDNIPGVRDGSAAWTDSSGDLWLFGGYGAAPTGPVVSLNDLWKFDIASAEWTWVGGNDTAPTGSDQCPAGSYGTLGSASSTNLPTGRSFSGSWVDKSGAFWMFGGGGCNANESGAYLNDLWRYQPGTGEWTWAGGSNLGNSGGTFGTLGAGSTSNIPSSRANFAYWTDAKGNFWLFGGYGFDSASQLGYLNDLWQFNPATRQWTWMSGSNTIGTPDCADFGLCSRPGVYGTLGQPAPGNTPGGRWNSSASTVANGDFLLFGGQNLTINTNTFYNDLWEFDPTTGLWAWIGGDATVSCGTVLQGMCAAYGKTGVYGTESTPAATNSPGSRADHLSWADSAGNFWIFGGFGYDSQGIDPVLNDIWEYRTYTPVVPVATTVSVTSSANPVFTQNAFTLTAHVASTTTPPKSLTGTVEFSESVPTTGISMSLGTAALDASGNAALSVASLPVGSNSITAAYSGDVNNVGSTASTTELVGDFSLVAGPPVAATIKGAGSASFTLALMPIGPITTFPASIALTASGGPRGATYTFAPASIAAGSAVTNATLTVAVAVQPAPATARLWWPALPAVPLALAGLLLPFARRASRAKGLLRKARPAAFLLAIVGSGAALSLTGCGNKFYTGKLPPVTMPQTYTIEIVGSSGGLVHSTTVALLVD